MLDIGYRSGGGTDVRRRGLQSIADYAREGPAIDPVFSSFRANYWSSTSNVAFPEFACVVGFTSGDTFNAGRKIGRNLVRAVRSGP